MTYLEPEAGIWYGVCWITLIARLAARRLHLKSWRALQLDDYLIILAMITDTVLNVVMDRMVTYGNILLYPDEDASTFSPEEAWARSHGSKLCIVVEQMQIATVWLTKACILIIYARVTGMLSQYKLVIATAIYVGITWVVMEILFFGVWCRPFHNYWAFPPHPRESQCATARNHMITNAVFTLSSDLLILMIPIPLVFKIRLPLKHKLMLAGVFLVGIFTIIAALLNKYYVFAHPYSQTWTIWYLREFFTAIICTNLPLTYPLIQRAFGLRNWSSHAYTPNQSREMPTHISAATRWRRAIDPQSDLKTFNETINERSESQENIHDKQTKQNKGQGESDFITSAIGLQTMNSTHDSSSDLCTIPEHVEESKKSSAPHRIV